jgi:putative DNA primase/helicase
VDAARLDAWRIGYCQEKQTHLVPITQVQKRGPNGLRKKQAIETAMHELEEAGRACRIEDGKRRVIAVNPKLLIEGGK